MTADNFTRVPESFPPQAAWPMPHELQQQPSRVSGAAHQVETRSMMDMAMESTATQLSVYGVCQPDPIAAAEREVIEEAIAWYHRWRREPEPVLTRAVSQLLRLRAAREPKP